MNYLKSYKNLIQYCLEKGLLIEVSYEGEVDLPPSSNFHEIVDAVESCECMNMAMFDGEKVVGWAFVISGLDDEESVADYGVSPLLEDWEADYSRFMRGKKL